MEEPLGYRMKLNNLVMGGHILCDPTHVGVLRRQTHAKVQKTSKISVTRG